MKIIDIIAHAYNTVPFYYNRLNGSEIPVSLDGIPILHKFELNDDVNSLISSSFIKKYLKNELLWERTSGSTGIASEVYWDYRDYKRSLLCLWIYRRKYYNITPKDKLIYFISSDIFYNEYIEFNYRKGISKKYIIENRMDEAYLMVLEYNPVWMILQPSVALLLCKEAEKHSKTPSNLRYIELTGEYLTDEVRNIIIRTFDCYIANQYGTKEVNSIAYECPYGNMHIMDDNVYVESLNLDEEEGHIVVTSKHNRAMPVLRLDTGDIGVIEKNIDCRCGLKNNVLRLRQGRDNDGIMMIDNTKKNPYIIFQILNNINYITDGTIIQYQIVQKSIFEFTIYLVTSNEFDDYYIKIIHDEFKQRLGYDIKLNVIKKDNIFPARKTGKVASFYSDIIR